MAADCYPCFSSVLFGSYLVICYICGMETVFDHNITKEEMEAILGSPNYTRERLESVIKSQISHYGMIYSLYTFRGDHKKAGKYADMIPDSIHKIFGICNHDFAHIS